MKLIEESLEYFVVARVKGLFNVMVFLEFVHFFYHFPAGAIRRPPRPRGPAPARSAGQPCSYAAWCLWLSP